MAQTFIHGALTVDTNTCHLSI